MVKSARILASFILLVFLSVSFCARSEAFDLIKPIPDETASYNPSFDFTSTSLSINAQDKPVLQKQSVIYTPSTTFGELLDGSYEQLKTTNQDQKEIIESVRVKEMLAKLEESYQQNRLDNELMEQFNNSTMEPFDLATSDVASLPASNQSAASDQQPATNDQILVPAPTSSVSNLIANISSLINSEPTNDQRLTTNDHQLNLGDPKKTWVSIAFLGDSMTDTLGPDLLHLSNLLKENYPDYTFNLLNYGQGATDIESGLNRLTNTTNYLGKELPPLLSYQPDILIVESFAYNPWTWEKYDLDRQWLTIARIIDSVKTNSPQTKIILAATIAPNTKIFGDGSLNWNQNDKWKKATTIKLYLQNLVNFATSQNYPLADAYHTSLDASGEGQEKYINGGDHLHLSEEGKQLYAQKIVETIKQYNLIQ